MAYPADWLPRTTGVLQGLGAQVSPGNLASLWSWTQAKPPGQPMRWNNPLNTTQTAPGSTPNVIMQKNPLVAVQSYPSIAEGVHATLTTLHDGFYPQIVATLVSGRPASQWQNACVELQTWGTGCGWLSTASSTPGGQGQGSPAGNFLDVAGVATEQPELVAAGGVMRAGTGRQAARRARRAQQARQRAQAPGWARRESGHAGTVRAGRR